MTDRKALLVGINRYGNLADLPGCLNDVTRWAEHLERHEGFDCSQLRMLTNGRATKRGILEGLHWLLKDARPGDVRLFVFSGHGVQLPSYDPAGRELDGLDECLCPSDFDWTNERTLRDSELVERFSELPEGVRLTWVSDSCHSGDLERSASGRSTTGTCTRTVPPPADVARAIRASRRKRPRRAVSPDLRGLLLSASREDQTALDAPLGPEGKPHGAFTFHLLAVLRRLPGSAMTAVMREVRAALRENDFPQEPMLTGEPGMREAPFLGSGKPASSESQSRVGSIPPIIL